MLTSDPKIFLSDNLDNSISKNSMDLSGRIVLQGFQQRNGYLIFFPEFEFRNTQTELKRFSVNIGYVFNNIIIIPKSEIGLSISYGKIEQYNQATGSMGLSVYLGLIISEKLKFIQTLSINERSDLDLSFPTAFNARFKTSLKFGFAYAIFQSQTKN